MILYIHIFFIGTWFAPGSWLHSDPKRETWTLKCH